MATAKIVILATDVSEGLKMRKLIFVAAISFAAPVMAQANSDEIEALSCGILKSAIGAVIEFGVSENSLMELRDERVLINALPEKQYGLKRPKSIDRKKWKRFAFFAPAVAPSKCSELEGGELNLTFAATDVETQATKFKVLDFRVRDDGNAYYTVINAVNQTAAPESDQGSILARVLTIIGDADIGSRIQHVDHAYYAGKRGKIVVIKRCNNPDDLSDCKFDTARGN